MYSGRHRKLFALFGKSESRKATADNISNFAMQIRKQYVRTGEDPFCVSAVKEYTAHIGCRSKSGESTVIWSRSPSPLNVIFEYGYITTLSVPTWWLAWTIANEGWHKKKLFQNVPSSKHFFDSFPMGRFNSLGDLNVLIIIQEPAWFSTTINLDANEPCDFLIGKFASPLRPNRQRRNGKKKFWIRWYEPLISRPSHCFHYAARLHHESPKSWNCDVTVVSIASASNLLSSQSNPDY